MFGESVVILSTNFELDCDLISSQYIQCDVECIMYSTNHYTINYSVIVIKVRESKSSSRQVPPLCSHLGHIPTQLFQANKPLSK